MATRVGSPSPRPFALPRLKIAASTLFNRSDSRLSELRLHNLQRGSCRLPEQVLRQIFELCAATSIGRPNAELSLPSPRTHGRQSSGGDQTWSWVMVSYVCHAWRKVALEFPELWRYIDFSHPRWTAVTLSRAKMQSLYVHAVVGRHNLQQLHRTLQFAHRIGSIYLDSSLHHIHGLLDTIVHPNPSVESITVRVNTAGHGVEGQVYPPPAYPLVGPPLGSLRYLELHSSPFYLISDRYVSLRELHVHDLTPCQRPTIHEFLRTLENFKDLEHLSLDNAFPLLVNSVPFPHLHSPPISPKASPQQSPSSSPPTGPLPPLPPLLPSANPSALKIGRISLPKLSTLHLTGSIAEITTILNIVNLPPDVSLTCAITSLADWQQSMPKLAQALNIHSWASATGGCPIETIVLTGKEEDAYPAAQKGMIYGGAHTLTPLTSKSIRLRGFSSGLPRRRPSARARSPVRGGSPSGRASATRTPSLDLIIGPDSDPDFSTDEVIVGALCSVWKALSLGNVQTLALHDMDLVTQKTWTLLMKTLPSLRVLDVTGFPPSGFFWALLLNAVACIQREERERERRQRRERKFAQRYHHMTADDRSASPDELSPTSPLTPNPLSSRSLFVPKLADIYLHGVDCSMGGHMVAQNAPVNSHADLDDSRFLDVLLACLQMRSQASAVWGGSTSPWPTGSCSSPPSATFTLSPGSESYSKPGSPVQFDLLPTQNKLRSVSLANCRSVPKGTALLLGEFVSHCVWDQRGMMKPEEDTGLARYRRVVQGPGGPRHYYRLKTLLDELDV